MIWNKLNLDRAFCLNSDDPRLTALSVTGRNGLSRQAVGVVPLAEFTLSMGDEL